MVQQDKDLLLQDLCARLPYGVKCVFYSSKGDIPTKLLRIDIQQGIVSHRPDGQSIIYCSLFENLGDKIKPYLRPISSMTEQECLQLSRLKPSTCDAWKYVKTPVPLHIANLAQFDFFHSHHLDWRGLIEKELALDCTNLNIY